MFFSKNETIESITLSLNSILEKMIVINPVNGYGHTIVGNKLIFFISSYRSFFIRKIRFLILNTPVT